jgi:kinesin family member C2/C3
LPKDFGISYLSLNDLFNISTSREDVKYDIRVQMVEIYNEQVRDLLGEDTSSSKYPYTSYKLFCYLYCIIICFVAVLIPDKDFTLDIRTSSNNGLLSLPDAMICPVQSPSDVINLMQLGEKHRASGSTAMNHRSSRSHRLALAVSSN